MGMRGWLEKVGYWHVDKVFWVLFALAAVAAIGAILGSLSALVLLVILAVAAGVYKLGEILRMRELDRQMAGLHGGVQSVHARVGEVGLAVGQAHAEHKSALERTHWDLAKKVLEHRDRTEDLHTLVAEKHEEHKKLLESKHTSLVRKLAAKTIRRQLREITEQLAGLQTQLEARNTEHAKNIEVTYRDLARKIIEIENRLNQTARVLKAAGETATME